MSEKQERHYNISKLNILFAVSSILLLGAVVAMFVADYSREWKGYQKEFRNLEIEKTRVKYDKEASGLSESAEYRELLQKIEDAEQVFQKKTAELAEINKAINKLQARQELADQRYRFTKADYDAARYEYEAAVSHGHGGAKEAKGRLGEFEKRLAELKLDLEDATYELKNETGTAEEYNTELKALESSQRTFRKQLDIVERKLKKLDPAEMSMINRVGDFVRDLPILDLANPNYKVKQVVLKDLTDDVNFMKVPKVDRCITCHLGVLNPDYKDAPQPFTTHPNLELFLSTDSSHPIEEFGCTTCHGGRGRGTDFVSSVHVPSSEEQKKEWEEKYHWHKLHHWDAPMLAEQYVEASCFKCHSGQTAIKGAEKLNLGLNLIERSGCYSCHLIEKYKDWPKPGPSLKKLSAKTSKDWTYRWINDPKSFRHTTWMPAFFGLDNNNDPESKKRSEQQIHAIVHYLFEKSEDFELKKVPFAGDIQRGEEIVASLGCFGCHNMNPEDVITTRQTLKQEHGPSLTALGTKTNKEWLYQWLKDPSRYHAGTRMPNLRLTDQEAADVTVYLVSDQKNAFMKGDLPKINEPVIDAITEEFLLRSNPVAQTQEKLKQMSLDEKLMYTGEKLIRHYGCYGCHEISGFDKAKPIGTELTEEGSKSADRLDFGFIDIPHTKEAWFTQKLKSPRIFDQNKVKNFDEKLRMPDFSFTDDEVEAIVTALLGFVKEIPAESKLKPRTPKNLFIEEGQELVRQFNCQGCHLIEGEGAAIQSTVAQWLIDFQKKNKTEAEALSLSFSPPNLIGEGKKVQAQWLFNFLHQPSTVRPWLKVRMPTFDFDAAQLNTFVKYFNYLDDEEFPFSSVVDPHLAPEEYKAGKMLFSKDYFDCAQCHIVGDQFPSGSADRWAPNFTLAKERLKPEWIDVWLQNPQDLLPGTKMPTYFDPEYFDYSGPDDILDGDENQQIKALRNYIMSLADTSKMEKDEAPAQEMPAPLSQE